MILADIQSERIETSYVTGAVIPVDGGASVGY
jgi:NAD(P)-dependent dehydrogenase (short-subunit alcohol dehydrogenase family)